MLDASELIDNDMVPPETDLRPAFRPVCSAAESAPGNKQIADASIVCDRDGIVVSWNEGATRLLGWSADEAVGKPALDLIALPQYRKELERDRQQFLKSGDHPCLNLPVRAIVQRKDLRTVDADCIVSTVCKEEHLYFCVSIRDRAANTHRKNDLKQYTSMLNLSRDAIFVTDPKHEILFWNSGAEKMFGYTEQEALGRKSDELLLSRYPADIGEIRQQLEIEGHWEGEISYTTRDGLLLLTLSRWALEHESAQGDARILMSNTNVNVWKRHFQTPGIMKEEDRNFESLFGLHPDGVLAFDVQGRLFAANPALSAMTGYSNKELLSMPLAQLVAPEDLGKLRFNFAEALRGTAETHEFTGIKKNKTRFDASVTMLPHRVNNRISGLHVIVRDVSHRKMDERRIHYLATHDSLTNLANRNLLNDRMRHAIEQARQSRSHVGLLFMDLNRFKVVNDSLGHDKGDMLLCTIAERLKGAVREADTVARLGGDEFVILLENVGSPDQLSAVAKNLLKLVRQPVEIDEDLITVSTSIGGSLFPQDGTDPAALLKNADLAMYEAKQSGFGSFRMYTPDMNVRAAGQLARENSLRRAIDLGELVLHYQPRLDIVRNEVAAVEALVRWNHPEKGLILPAHFIPLAEEIGVIDMLGEWVLLTACRQLKAWQNAGLPPMKMSVNVSALQLRSDRIFDAIQSALADTHIDPACLDLEITESSLMQNLDASRDKLMKIRNLGISLSIDDFGTGYSSLSYLKRLPIDTLKIDKSFVSDVPENVDDSAIVSATIAMAHSMNLRVVAEGVTSFEQMRFLDACHCDEIQGYLLCRPLSPPDTESFLKTSQMRGTPYSWAH